MRKVLIYEYAASGGLCDVGRSPLALESIVREGRAMLSAIAADFAAIEHVTPIVMLDHRLIDEFAFPNCELRCITSPGQEQRLLSTISAEADGTIVIAPEFDGLLHKRCRWVEQAGGRLIGPSSELVSIAADKHRTAQRLAAAGVRTPAGMLLDTNNALPVDFRYPAVLKPIDGAGSLDVFLLRGPQLPSEFDSSRRGPYHIEEYCHGTAVSVALLCGPTQRVALPPCHQRLSSDGRFRYLGGATPLSADLAQRAQSLAERAVAALPAPRGYIGVDLVLASGDHDAGDTVIEINPRLTTSYVGHRARSKGNLAEAMWQIASGSSARLEFTDEAVQFNCDGSIERQSPAR